jgi:16S rRNA (adenine1518-N6/adenine1519-N6)-dimethyltransferase
VRPKKRFGQHFLQPEWADRVVDAIAPAKGDRFLEIGPGPGVLTTRLAAQVAHVTAIEIDRDLAADLRQTLPSNVELVTGDILDVDLEALLTEGPVRVAGNLPYNIASPILFRLLSIAGASRAGERVIDAALMIQREVADRLVARPGTKDYGVLTIFVSVHADVTRLLTLPPGAFRPVPKVHSAVVRLSFVPPRVPVDLQGTFERMVRVMFTQRRKTVENALRPFAESLGCDAAAALSAGAVDPRARPETLELPALRRLASVFGAASQGSSLRVQGLKPKA